MLLFAPKKIECKKLRCSKKMAPGVAQVATFQLHPLAPTVDVDKIGFM